MIVLHTCEKNMLSWERVNARSEPSRANLCEPPRAGTCEHVEAKTFEPSRAESHLFFPPLHCHQDCLAKANILTGETLSSPPIGGDPKVGTAGLGWGRTAAISLSLAHTGVTPLKHREQQG